MQILILINSKMMIQFTFKVSSNSNYNLFILLECAVFCLTDVPGDVQIYCENNSSSINCSFSTNRELLIGSMELFFNILVYSGGEIINETLTNQTTFILSVNPAWYCLQVAAVVQGSTKEEGQEQGNFSETTIRVIEGTACV